MNEREGGPTVAARIRAALPRAAVGLLSLASLLHAASLVPRYARPVFAGSFRESMVSVLPALALTASLGGPVLALLLVVRSWHRPGAREVAVFLAAVAAAWGAVLRFFRFEAVGWGLSFHGQGGGAEIVLLVLAVNLSAAAFLRFGHAFPPAKGGAGGSEEAATGLARLGTARVAWALGLGWPVLVLGVGAAVVRLSGGEVDGGPALLLVLLLLSFNFTAVVLGSRGLIRGYRRASPEQRRTLLWLVVGVEASAWMLVLPLLAPMPPAWATVAGSLIIFGTWCLSPAVLVASVAVAMFYTGGVDPALVLRRTTLVGIGTAVWIAAFTAAENLFSDWAAAALGVPAVLVSVTIALAAAGGALMLRRVRGGAPHPPPTEPDAMTAATHSET